MHAWRRLRNISRTFVTAWKKPVRLSTSPWAATSAWCGLLEKKFKNCVLPSAKRTWQTSSLSTPRYVCHQVKPLKEVTRDFKRGRIHSQLLVRFAGDCDYEDERAQEQG